MFKGWLGEKKTQFSLWLSLDTKLYQRFHDVIILSNNGTTQIDHILVSPFGIFVIETKNYRGWIYGSDSQSNWTQVIYKSKYSFQNPLRQTHRHKKVLSKYLGINELHIQTVISFTGDVKFKTELPSNVLRSGVGSYIKKFKDKVFSDKEIERIIDLLSNLKSEIKISKEEHIQSLHNRHTSETICPSCGTDLLKRTVKKGAKQGSHFLGCSSFPRCRYTKELESKSIWKIITIIMILFLLIIVVNNL